MDKKEKKNLYMKQYRDKNKSRIAEVANPRRRERRMEKRIICISKYSESMSCSCCGEKEIKFLSFDHVDSIGNKIRRNKRTQEGSRLVDFLFANNFPSGFQVLCYNCNLAKGFYGECPHKK